LICPNLITFAQIQSLLPKSNQFSPTQSFLGEAAASLPPTALIESILRSCFVFCLKAIAMDLNSYQQKIKLN